MTWPSVAVIMCVSTVRTGVLVVVRTTVIRAEEAFALEREASAAETELAKAAA
jgi:hypothetical protein